MARWQAKLEQRQGFLARVVDIGAELFAMTAACMRAERLRQEDPERGAAAYELAEAFCVQARTRIRELFRRLWVNADDSDDALAKQVLAGRYTWVEEGVLHLYPDGPWIAGSANGPSAKENLARRMI